MFGESEISDNTHCLKLCRRNKKSSQRKGEGLCIPLNSEIHLFSHLAAKALRTQRIMEFLFENCKHI